MATSEVSICNKGLILLGEDVIDSLDDEVKAAVLCKEIFNQTRDALLRRHPWNFATKRATLAKSSTGPNHGYAYSYPLPNEVLRVMYVEYEKTYPFKIEQRNIVTDNVTIFYEDDGVTIQSQTIDITYIAKITDPNQFDSLFIDLFSSRLALELSIPLTDSRTRRDEMKELYAERLADVTATDALEEVPTQPPQGTWLDSRIVKGASL